MERGVATTNVVVGLVLGLLLGQSMATTSFKECYIPCFIFCVIKPNETAYYCSFECLKDCILIPLFPPPTSNSNNYNNNSSIQPKDVDHHAKHFCKLGCASSLCTNISTRQNPGGEKVESCVGSCSKRCIKNYVSP